MEQPHNRGPAHSSRARWMEQIEGLVLQVQELTGRHRGRLVALTVLAPEPFLTAGFGDAVVHRLGSILPGVTDIALRSGGNSLRVFEAEFYSDEPEPRGKGGSP